ncbi:hypothetical protein [Microcoleus sp. PH2017_18_LLB_O_A]|nr:hypothetical protein [Microcoleus sp. PH2017_18_LLB_O_A]MCC3516546.1 hypothetical protein [Microcoleus sp. PH2017_18_LLB_O_A]
MTIFILNSPEKLPPTQKLWIDEPYQTECEATVLHKGKYLTKALLTM